MSYHKDRELRDPEYLARRRRLRHQYYVAHQEKGKEYAKSYCRRRIQEPEWRKRVNEKARNHRRKLSKELRNQLFDIYGTKCSCCDESNPGFLTLDHVLNNGRKERVALNGSHFNMWRKAIAEHDPGKYRILCYNCNMGRAKNDGICPHVSLRSDSHS